MHSYIEFAHFVNCVALLEQDSVEVVLDNVHLAVSVVHVNVLLQSHVLGSAVNEHMHNLFELVISVFVELVQVWVNLLRHVL